MKVLITGYKGTLGKDVGEAFASRGHEVIGTDREDLDITNFDTARTEIQSFQPDLLINTAAFNAVDAMEEPEGYNIGYKVNATGPENLAKIAAELNIPFIHYSTDYVFDGSKKDGYTEEDELSPISKYGESKAAGEQLAQAAGGEVYIIRLSRLFGEPGESDQSKPSFIATMIDLAKKHPKLSIVDEETGTPAYSKDIAEATYELVMAQEKPGIYHMVNSGHPVTWLGFAKEAFEIEGIKIPIEPVSASAFPRPAKRPAHSALLNTKLAPLPSRYNALERFLKKNN